MSRNYDLITFDCYGTLIDWNQGIRTALAHAAAHAHYNVDSEVLLTLYHQVEPLVQAEQFRSYHDVLAESAIRVAHHAGWEMTNIEAEVFAASIPTWPAFSDTNAALQRLVKAGYQLAILSNIDDTLLAGTMHHLHVPFEFVITAQQVNSYKPAYAHFDTALTRVEGRRWLHAAQSYFHDIRPCGELGIPAVWVNRLHEGQPSDGSAPLAIVPDLTGLADWLGA